MRVERGEERDSQEVETLHLFQTVKMSIEAWQLVNKLSQEENIPFSTALERLVRHGSIRYEQVVREQATLPN